MFASNIGGTATLIGDPPNIIIASRANLSFNDFLIHLTPIVVVLIVAFLGLCRIMFPDVFRETAQNVTAQNVTAQNVTEITDLRPVTPSPTGGCSCAAWSCWQE